VSDLQSQITQLHAQGQSEYRIARDLGITRHAARAGVLRATQEAAPIATKLAALEPMPGAPASAWAARITACWRASVEAILEVGRLLTAAKEALPHGEFGKMVEADLPFGDRTAQMLMAIAADPQISNPKFISHLPANWGALYELSTLKLNEEQFERGIEKGAICPDAERKLLVNGARSVMGSRVEPDGSLDFFPTPPWATRALVELVLGDQLGSIWEPACGEGHMAEVLREYCDNVDATDIFDYGYGIPDVDFLNPVNAGSIQDDWIITNPPFGDVTEQFVLRALDVAKIGVAMFVRVQWLESVGRYEAIFRDRPPTCVAFFAERVNLCKGRWEPDGTTASFYIWLVWIKGVQPRPPFWIPPGQRERLTKPDDAERFTQHPVRRANDRVANHHAQASNDPDNRTAAVANPAALSSDTGAISTEDQEPADALAPQPSASAGSLASGAVQ
jgi:hypothetical protein